MGSLDYRGKRPHVVVLPYPAQGHINPLMEFAKRLASKNLRVTFVTTETARERMLQAHNDAAHGASRLHDIRIETISDGLSPNLDGTNDADMVIDLLRKVGGLSFQNLIERLNNEGERVSCIVYDSLLEWVPDIANKLSIHWAFFCTQSCAVYSIYYHYHKALIVNEEDETNNVRVIPGLPLLDQSYLPSFLQTSNPYPFFMKLALHQFTNISQAKWILGNSFNELETEEIRSMDSHLRIRTVGPLVPSAFLDGNNPRDGDVGAHLWKATNCIDWLNTKAASTVIYVSFGSCAVLSKEQIREIGLGLKASRHSFLWVIRPGDKNEEYKSPKDFPVGFLEEIEGKGLVVPWCPQMAVLSHPSVGLFMTHCGWNSTLESMISGIPLLAVPQWNDQTTNSKYIEEQWKTGIRLNRREDGLIGREEVENAIKKVMESEMGVELRKNVLRWKIQAKQAMGKDGSSEKNIEAFVEEVIATAKVTVFHCHCLKRHTTENKTWLAGLVIYIFAYITIIVSFQ